MNRVLGTVVCLVALALPGRAQPGPEPGILLHDMTFVGSRGPHTDVLLQARSARIPEGSEVAYLTEVEARVSGEGTGSFEMTCQRASYDVRTNDFVAEGQVRGRTGDGRRFETDKLFYDHARALARTDVPVTIVDAHGRYRGGGFRYHVGQGRFELVRGASVIQE